MNRMPEALPQRESPNLENRDPLPITALVSWNHPQPLAKDDPHSQGGSSLFNLLGISSTAVAAAVLAERDGLAMLKLSRKGRWRW